MIFRRAIGLGLLCLLLVALPANPKPPRLVYGGSSDFAPYEYLDTNGRPRGFNSELVQALGREMGREVVFRLEPGRNVLADLESGRVDLASLTFSESRARKYDFLSSTWMLRQAILFRHDRDSYPRRLDQLAPETIAVARPSMMYDVLADLPAALRPSLQLVETQTEAVRRLAQGQVTAAAGNELALNYAAQQLSQSGFHAIEVKSLNYHLVTRKGRREEFADLARALQKVRDTGEFSALVEKNLTAGPRDSWRHFRAYLGWTLGVSAAAFLFIGLWNRSLRCQVRARVRDLAESEARARAAMEDYRDLFEHIPIGVYRTTPDGRILAANPSLLKILGKPAFQALASRNLEEPGYEPEYSRSEFRRRLDADGEFRVPEVLWRLADGARILVREFAKAIRGPSGEILYYEGAVENITEQKQAHEAMLASEQRYRALFENANDVVYTLDLCGKFTSVNQAGERIFGHPRGELIGTTFQRLVAPEYNHSTTAASEAYEIEIVSGNGRRALLELSTQPIALNGASVGWQGIGRDITERRLLEKQLSRSQKLEAAGMLAGGVAHDFNNWLTVIRGYCALILDRVVGGDERRAAEEIDRAANRAASLTQQLLAFSRRQVLQPKVIGLHDVVKNMEDVLRRLIGGHIELIVADRNSGFVKADPGQIERVILNLAVNARDAMPHGGRLSLDTSSVDLGESHNGVATIPGSYVRLQVTDTGTGMDAETQARVFEPFFTTKETGRGTGLGLATVYGIVNQSGGYIFMSSVPGKGTSFGIYLPRVEPEAAETAREPHASTIHGRETIFLVEDEHALRQVARRFLQSKGFRVIDAACGDVALEMARAHAGEIHLLIADLALPDMTGQELASSFQAIHPETLALFMSGYTQDVAVQNGIVAEEAGFIQKPFALSSLARKAREILDGGTVRLA